MPGVNGLGVVTGGVRNAENAECTDCVTIASIAERWTGLKPECCWELGTIGMSGSGSDSNISSIEDKEALSDRALSSCSCSRLDGTFRLRGRFTASSDGCDSMAVLFAERPRRALG